MHINACRPRVEIRPSRIPLPSARGPFGLRTAVGLRVRRCRPHVSIRFGRIPANIGRGPCSQAHATAPRLTPPRPPHCRWWGEMSGVGLACRFAPVASPCLRLGAPAPRLTPPPAPWCFVTCRPQRETLRRHLSTHIVRIAAGARRRAVCAGIARPSRTRCPSGMRRKDRAPWP